MLALPVQHLREETVDSLLVVAGAEELRPSLAVAAVEAMEETD